MNGSSPSRLSDIARSGALALVGAVCAAVLGLALVIVVGRGLGAAGAGLFFQAVAAFSIVQGLATLGADTALLRGMSRQHALGRLVDGRALLAVAAVPVATASALVALVVVLQSGRVARSFPASEQGDVSDYVHVLAPVLVLGALGLLAAQAIRGLGSLTPYVLLQNVLVPALRLLLVGIVVGVGLGPVWVALGWGLPLVLAGVAAAAVLRRRLAGLERSEPEGNPTSRAVLSRQFWGFAAPRGAAAVLDLALTWSDVLIVGALLSAREAGVYAAVSRFALSGTLVLQAMRLATAPRFSALFATRREQEAGALYRSSTVWVVLASWPLYLVLALFAPVVLRLFGPEFVVGAGTLSIIALGMLVNVGTGSVQTVLLMAGRSSWLLGNKAAALAVNLTLNLLLVPRLGIEGAAIAWAAAIAVDNLSALLQVRFVLRLSLLGRGVAVSAVSSVVTFGLVGLLARVTVGPSLPSLAVSLAVAAAGYAVLVRRQREMLDLPALRELVAAPGAGTQLASLRADVTPAPAPPGATRGGAR